MKRISLLSLLLLGVIILYGCASQDTTSEEIGQKTLTEEKTSKSVEPPNCETDVDCMIQASKTCTPSNFIHIMTLDVFGFLTTTANYNEIKGTQADKCILYHKIESLSVEISDSQKQKLLDSGLTDEDINQEELAAANRGQAGVGADQTCLFTNQELIDIFTKLKAGGVPLWTGKCTPGSSVPEVSGTKQEYLTDDNLPDGWKIKSDDEYISYGSADGRTNGVGFETARDVKVLNTATGNDVNVKITIFTTETNTAYYYTKWRDIGVNPPTNDEEASEALSAECYIGRRLELTCYKENVHFKLPTSSPEVILIGSILSSNIDSEKTDILIQASTAENPCDICKKPCDNCKTGGLKCVQDIVTAEVECRECKFDRDCKTGYSCWNNKCLEGTYAELLSKNNLGKCSEFGDQSCSQKICENCETGNPICVKPFGTLELYCLECSSRSQCKTGFKCESFKCVKE